MRINAVVGRRGVRICVCLAFVIAAGIPIGAWIKASWDGKEAWGLL